MDEEKFEFANKLVSHVKISEAIAQNTELTSSHLDKIKNIWIKEEVLLKKHGDNVVDLNPQIAEISMHEIILDLTVLDITGKDLGHCIRIIKPNSNSFFLSEFADKMNQKYSLNGKYDWKSVSNTANPIINQMPGFPLLLGTLKFNAPVVIPAAKKRKAPVKRPKDERVERQQKAEQIVTLENKTDDIDWIKFNLVIQSLNRCFQENGNQAIPLYNFILHPTNFSTTVENIFQLSFVIREGLALIEVYDDDLFISPIEHKIKSNGNELSRSKQFILSITMPQWRELVELRNITQPAILWPDSKTMEIKTENRNLN